MTKLYTNEKGQIVLTLPISGQELTFRSPKGRDLKALELATKADDATNVGVLMQMAESLNVPATGGQALTVEDVEDMDAEDVAVLFEALSSFRAFRKFAAK